MKAVINYMALRAKVAFGKFVYDEEGDVNIVSMVVLIGIAVLLAVFFRSQVQGLLNTLFETITQNANNAVGGE